MQLAAHIALQGLVDHLMLLDPRLAAELLGYDARRVMIAISGEDMDAVERVIITDPGRPTFYELCDIARQKHHVELHEWYATEPRHFVGEVVEIRPG